MIIWPIFDIEWQALNNPSQDKVSIYVFIFSSILFYSSKEYALITRGYTNIY